MISKSCIWYVLNVTILLKYELNVKSRSKFLLLSHKGSVSPLDEQDIVIRCVNGKELYQLLYLVALTTIKLSPLELL